MDFGLILRWRALVETQLCEAWLRVRCLRNKEDTETKCRQADQLFEKVGACCCMTTAMLGSHTPHS